MPTYDFACAPCAKDFDVTQSIRDYDGKAICPTCGQETSDRVYTSDVHIIGAKVEDREFNHGLGIVTKNARHRKDEARARGLEEVGTSSPQAIHDHCDRERSEKRRKMWEDL